MNPYNLKTLCAVYHKKTAADLTIESVDLFLVALNNALRNAQLLHSFELSRVSATLAIDGATGGALADAVISGAVSEIFTVTSTAAAGNYTRQGSFSGYPLYVLAGATTYFLFYNADAATYVISTILTTGALTTGWVPATDLTQPTGSYSTNVGGTTGTATVALASVATWAGLKEVVAIRRSNVDGTTVPLDFTRADIPIERDRTHRELNDYYDPRERYPSDADILNSGDNTSIIQRRGTLFIYPTPTVVSSDDLNVVLEAYAWLPTIDAVGTSAAADPNFLLTYGADWLQWSIIEELNYRFQTFVPRTEGNLGTPTDLKNEAWRNLLLWDSYMIDSNATRSR